nr:MAG TPA: hypothetical protein [Caudoviricetes sp.]
MFWYYKYTGYLPITKVFSVNFLLNNHHAIMALSSNSCFRTNMPQCHVLMSIQNYQFKL